MQAACWIIGKILRFWGGRAFFTQGNATCGRYLGYRTMKRTGTLIFLLCCILSGSARGVDVSRVLKTFDFEERSLGNDESLPMHWIKLTGQGLPHYVNGQLSTDRHRSGNYSFRFDLNGGSLIYRYGAGLISVQRGAHYHVDGYCQTTPMPHARARITAYFVDIDGRMIPSSVAHSPLYAASQSDADWKKLSLEVSADAPTAASLVIELEALQPEFYTAPTTVRPLFPQDIHGSIWWDDIAVSQVPEISLRTGKPGNVFDRNEPVRLGIIVSDRSTDDLVARISVRDAEAREVYQRTGRPEIQRETGVDTARGGTVLELPPLKPGWYEAHLAMSSGGRSLGVESISFVVLPDHLAPAKPDPRFGFIATDLSFDAWETLPQTLPMLSAGRVKLAVWSEAGDVEQNHGAAFDRLLGQLAELGITPTACLTNIPPRILQSLGESDWKQLLKMPPAQWKPDLAFLISRHANHLDRWQLGADSSPDFVTDPQMRDVYRRVLAQFSQFMDKPDLAMPWPAWCEVGGNDLPATIALSVSPSILPEQIPLYVQEVRGRSDHNLSLTLEPIDRAKYGRKVQIRDLAQRVIYALSAGSQRIDLPFPFNSSRDRDGVSSQPKEMLLVLRTLISTLSGAQFKGKVALGEGVEAFLFDRGGHGILAIWNRGGVETPRKLALNLGERPVSIDLWGNANPLPRPAGDTHGYVTLSVGAMPIFLVDIDGPQAQLRASVAIDRPMIESSFHPHMRHLRFTNTYPQSISGNVRMRAPSGWTFNPGTLNFNLNPGETFDREIAIQFPYNSTVGTRTLNCDFFVEGQNSSSFSVPLELRLGLSDLGMQTIAMRDGNAIFVQQTITNYGDKPISYNAFATFPTQARQERLVNDLQPGSSTIRRYRFENVKSVDGQVRVGVKELGGTRMLNYVVDVP